MAEMSPQPLLTARGAVQAWGGMRAASARAPNPNPAPKTSPTSVGVRRTLTGAALSFLTVKSQWKTLSGLTGG